MTYIVIASILLLVALVAFVVAAFTKNSDYSSPRAFALGVGVVFLVLLGLYTLFASMETVGARSVGIQTAFGRYQDTLGPGLQLIAPWSSVEEFSTQIQDVRVEVPVTFAGEPVPNEDGTLTNATKTVGGGNGTASAKVRWFISEDDAEALWKKYRNFDRVRDALVISSSEESVRVVVGKYTPTEANAGDHLREITEGIVDDLESTLNDDGIKIDSVSGTAVNLDEKTQGNVDKTVAANQDIVTALARERRAIIDGRTVQKQNESGALEGDALIRYCLDVVNAWNVTKNGPLPAGFSCNGTSVPFAVTAK